MNEIKTVKIHCLSTAVSPLTHMMGTSGNESIINRTRIIADGRICDVPVISGNAIRHRMVREPGAMFIIKTCELMGKLTVDVANYLFYGGSLTDSAIADNLRRIADMQELLPLYRLLGGSLKNQVISGSLLVSMGTLVCEENREVLGKLLPEEMLPGLPELRSCEDFVSGWQYTRGDISKKPEIIKDADAARMAVDTETGEITEIHAPSKSNLMIYGGQHVIPGAIFYHSFVLQNVSRLEVGALYAAIKDWQADGGVIGGQGRIGHGKLDTVIYPEGNNFFGDAVDLEAYEQEYREHTKVNAPKIIDWLTDAFAVKVKTGSPRAAKVGKSVTASGSKEIKNPVAVMDLFNAEAEELF